MKTLISISIALLLAATACEQKPTADAETVDEPSTAAQHVNTDREAFKAAGKAAKQIENKGAERNKAADEALRAGE